MAPITLAEYRQICSRVKREHEAHRTTGRNSDGTLRSNAPAGVKRRGRYTH